MTSLIYDLLSIYDIWLTNQNLPKGYSAEDLALSTKVNEEQKQWLLTFAKLWELTGC